MHLRAADRVVGDLALRHVRRDALHPADDVAAFDHVHAVAHRVGHVDALAELVAEHVDRAVADVDRRAPNMDAVELRSRHGNTVERRAAPAVDSDPVLAPDDGDVLDRHVVCAHDDAAANDGSRRAHEHLSARDHERPLVDARGQVHDRR